MNYIMYFSVIMLVVIHIYFYSIYSHLLSALMLLEAMVLFLLFFTVSFTINNLEGLTIYLFTLTLSVCEASLGLSLLMSMVKMKGNDLIKSHVN
uniref:NADH-ubiquinone oxidoreductase chain 4L n=1 Tax=Zaptyx inversiluna TaxID=1885844 RepID=A0A224AAY7_9EUPU|nr:NADH dehydrogenase subunit 4L [Zaptyx inversiluna]